MTLEDNVQRLSRLSLISKVEPGALRLLASAADVRKLRAGDILFRQGDLSDCGYLIVSGAITLDGAGESRTLQEGDLLGELAMIVATKRPVTAIARQNSTVLRIPRALFLRVLEEFPASAERLRRQIQSQLNALSSDLDGYGRDLISDKGRAS